MSHLNITRLSVQLFDRNLIKTPISLESLCFEDKSDLKNKKTPVFRVNSLTYNRSNETKSHFHDHSPSIKQVTIVNPQLSLASFVRMIEPEFLELTGLNLGSLNISNQEFTILEYRLFEHKKKGLLELSIDVSYLLQDQWTTFLNRFMESNSVLKSLYIDMYLADTFNSHSFSLSFLESKGCMIENLSIYGQFSYKQHSSIVKFVRVHTHLKTLSFGSLKHWNPIPSYYQLIMLRDMLQAVKANPSIQSINIKFGTTFKGVEELKQFPRKFAELLEMFEEDRDLRLNGIQVKRIRESLKGPFIGNWFKLNQLLDSKVALKVDFERV